MTAHGVSDDDLRRRYAQVFDEVAEEYDRERRGYPDELIDAVFRAGALSAGDRVVEVGCGTGLLTASLAARGLVVDAVDPGANMIRLAERRVGDNAAVRFHRGRFEEVTLPHGASPRGSRQPHSTGSSPRWGGLARRDSWRLAACSRSFSTAT